jgi:hypothetical protein
MASNFPPTSSPPFETWTRLADEYPIVRGPEFADGGVDTFLSHTVPVRRWRVTYKVLTLAQAAILDAWFTANFGYHSAFNFTDRDATVYGGVKCVEYERGHARMYPTQQFRTIVFEQRP